jgi:hypothetical protein
VIDAGGHVLVYAVAAAISPLVLTATFIVIQAERPREKGIAFLAGFLIGTAVACGLGLLLGDAAVSHFSSHTKLLGALTFLLGIALLVVGLRARRAPPPRTDVEARRSNAILERLSHVRSGTAFTMAVLLGFGGPKRLVLTFLAMASVTEAGVRGVADLTLVVVYIVIATSLVAVPVGVVLVAGDRAAAILESGESWLTAHAVPLRVWLCVGIGAALIADSIVRVFV